MRTNMKNYSFFVLAMVAFNAVAADPLPVGTLGYDVPRIRAESIKVTPSTEDGAFRTDCLFSHMAYDDPIVHWGQPGGSHLHALFGNARTDYKSTWESLGTGSSSCPGGSLNRSAYWVPAIVDKVTKQPVAPKAAQVYYKTGFGGVKLADIQPFPDRFRMVAGDHDATGPQDDTGFFCKDFGTNTKEIPAVCPAGSEFWAIVKFRQCWDGKNLDSDDHRSHMAPTNGNGCPASHPVALPQVSINAIYTVPPSGIGNWELSSDRYDASKPRGYSMHGDWYGRWNRTTQLKWLNNCLRARNDCHNELLGDGTELY